MIKKTDKSVYIHINNTITKIVLFFKKIHNIYFQNRGAYGRESVNQRLFISRS